MPENILLLPQPRTLHTREGQLPLCAGQTIRLIAPKPMGLTMAGASVQKAVREAAGWEWSLIAGKGGPSEGVCVTIEVAESDSLPEQGYSLTVSPQGATIRSRAAAGAFYGAQTLAQLIHQFPNALPCVQIEDYPDFPARGVMLDISRDKVPTLQTLYELVDLLASWKINQLQLYTEHTFAYRAHPEVWAEASPMTGEDILLLDAYCRERFVELVPNQNSFGHMDRWLKLPRYRPLAEAPDGYEYPWGGRSEVPFTLCPGDPGSLLLITELFDELLPHFSSSLFNVGCDETWDLGQGRSKAECEARGAERVYLDFLLKIYRLVKERGRTMMFWGDIILHRPELISELPSDAIALEWGYEADHPFDRDGSQFQQAEIPFYVCPGTSSWNTIAGRTDNAINNLRNAAENGLTYGAIGYLNTDWGDNGHLQYLPISYLGFAVGAAYAWSLEANRSLPIADALSLHAFRDSARVMGKLAYDLGNVYQKAGAMPGNASALFHILLHGDSYDFAKQGVTLEHLNATETSIREIIGRLDQARMARPDAALIAEEFRNAAQMLVHACRFGRSRLSPGSISPTELQADLRLLRGTHQRLWLARNRPGGLRDSLRRLELPGAAS
jgi:hexosaminidase